AKLKSAVISLMVPQRSVMVHVTVAEPPSHSCGTLTDALSFVGCGTQPLAAALAADCAVTQSLNAVSTAFWSPKSHDSRLVSALSLHDALPISAKLKSAVISLMVPQRSVMVQVTVAVPPSHSCGTLTDALSF